MAIRPAPACQYTVRDAGFADLFSSRYELTIHLPKDIQPDSISEIEKTGEGTFAETNIAFAIGPATEEPHAVLASPAGESLKAPLTAGSISRTLGDFASSPLRQRILERILEVYGIVVLVECPHPERNQAAADNIRSALARIKAGMGTMPKAVGQPPELLTLPASLFETERVLAWSLDAGDTVPQRPVASVLYGRGRKMGESLVGDEITEEKVYEILSVVGLDCECGLDRSWMQGMTIPLRWDESTERKAAQVLGFDPENPLTRMEIKQIVDRGASGRPGSSPGKGGQEDPLLGYSEQVIIRNESGDPPPITGPQSSSARAEGTGESTRPMPIPPAVGGSLSFSQLPLALVLIVSFICAALAAGFTILVRAKGRAG